MNLKQGIDELIREARRNTLNNRINHKGNYENYINGNSHALNNLSRLNDDNYSVIAIDKAKKGEVKNDYTDDEWIKGLNDRYTNPQHNERAGNAPYGSGLNYIHRYTPSTKRGRRVSDIFFQKARMGEKPNMEEYRELVNKYERR